MTQVAQVRGVEKEVVVQDLLTTWQEENSTRQTQWNLQIEEEWRLVKEEEARQWKEVERIIQKKEAEKTALKKEALKKQPQLIPILKNLWLLDSQPLWPSEYTI